LESRFVGDGAAEGEITSGVIEADGVIPRHAICPGAVQLLHVIGPE
jgi:hypothetical protein